MSLLIDQPTGVGSLAGDSSASGQGIAGERALTVEGNTAWPDALPEITDLPHASDCTECIEAGEDYEYIECDSGLCIYSGDAPIVDRSYSTVYAHCPNCGAGHTFARERDWDD